MESEKAFWRRRCLHLIIHHAIYSVNKYLLKLHNMLGPRLGAGDTAANKSDKVLCLHGVSVRILRKHRGISRKREAIWGRRESGIKVERAQRTKEMLCIMCAGNYRDFQSILGLTNREYLATERISATCRQLKRGFSSPLDLISFLLPVVISVFRMVLSTQ